MAKQTINTGTASNDGTGDGLRDAFVKVNENFDELYTSVENVGFDVVKISGNTIGTKDNPDTGGWGASWLYLDPAGEGWAGIAIPSLAAQQSGATLDIYNNNVGGGGIRFLTYGGSFELKSNGAIAFPSLPSNQRTGSGDNLQFEKSINQKIISTKPGNSNQPTVERLVIAGGDSYYDGTNYVGEGGDLYLWAGVGNDGGDIKVDAGNGTAGQGGSVKIRGGSSDSSTGGFVEIWSGYGANGAAISMYTYNSVLSGWNQWQFTVNGTITLPQHGDIKNSDGYSVIKSIPQNMQSGEADYTLVLSDAGKHVYKNDNSGFGVVVPTDAQVAFEVGTAITIVSGSSQVFISPADGDVTMIWGAGHGLSNANWYIPNHSMATLLKIASDEWMLSGAGLAENI